MIFRGKESFNIFNIIKMHFNFATLGLIATAIISSVYASVQVEGHATHALATVAASAEHANLMIAKRNYLSRRKVINVLERRRIVCDHKNHKTYRKGDEHRHHYHPHRHHRHNRCGDSDGHHCDNFDVDDFELESNNDFAEDEFNDFDDDYYECDECDACDDDEDDYFGWSDWEDETT